MSQEIKKAVADEKAAKDKKRYEDDNKIKIMGGFFVYRAVPTNDSKRITDLLGKKGGADDDVDTENSTPVASGPASGSFAQKGEITGMVLIKQARDRQFMTYAPIDTTTYTVDKFMEYFKDTMYNNKYDDSVEKVFEIEALGTLVNKLIVQTVE